MTIAETIPPTITMMDMLPTLVQTGMIVSAAVWAVATIKSTTKSLAVEIHQLNNAILRLDKAIEKIETRTVQHEVRLSVLEQVKQGHIQ